MTAKSIKVIVTPYTSVSWFARRFTLPDEVAIVERLLNVQARSIVDGRAVLSTGLSLRLLRVFKSCKSLSSRALFRANR